MDIEPANNPIDTRIYTVRGQSVMLDSDLATVYEVTTGNLNKAVDRNPDRFPNEFAFRLSDDEWDNLIFQSGTSRSSWGGRRKLPRVFTEHGAVMLASVLNSSRAVKASITVVNAFVRLRHVLQSNATLAMRIAEIEKQVKGHDRTITVIFHELKKLVTGEQSIVEEDAPKRRIGYRTPKEDREGKTKARKGNKKKRLKPPPAARQANLTSRAGHELKTKTKRVHGLGNGLVSRLGIAWTSTDVYRQSDLNSHLFGP